MWRTSKRRVQDGRKNVPPNKTLPLEQSQDVVTCKVESAARSRGLMSSSSAVAQDAGWPRESLQSLTDDAVDDPATEPRRPSGTVTTLPSSPGHGSWR